MNTRNTYKLFLVAGCVVVVVLLAAFGLVSKPNTPARADNILSLQAPPFVDVARAETLSATSVITEEAGMSAWFQASTSINLDNAKSVFRTIETETADYIIGSVPLSGYPESQDVHVYVHTDGWILAYYMAADPVGKIFDWWAYRDGGHMNITTKLENAITVVANAAGIPFNNATFYDFRYPNAMHLMLIVEWIYYETDSCEVNLPGEFDYYERSWSLGIDASYGRYKVDGSIIKDIHCDDCTFEGVLTVSQLLPDEFHTIEVSGNGYTYGGLALVYGIP